jgi:tight adherence protein B
VDVITWVASRRRLARLTPARHALLDRALDRTRYGRRLSVRLRRADVRRSPASFVRLSLAAGLGGATLAILWMGGPAGVVGLAIGCAAPEVSMRRRIATRSARVTAQLPEILAALAAPIRAGASLPQAFAAAAAEAEPPMREVLVRTTRDLDAGVPQDEAIARFTARCAVPEGLLVGRAMRIARQAGGELARVLDEVGETLRDRERLARELRAATAQARASATVVAALPVVFVAIMSAGAGDQAHLLFAEPVGWLLLAVGGSLEAAGVFWIRRLTAGVGGRHVRRSAA